MFERDSFNWLSYIGVAGGGEMRMKMARALVLLPIALLLVIPVNAAKPVFIAGTTTCCISNTVISTEMVDGNTVVTYLQQLTFAGDMQGVLLHTFTFVISPTGQLDITGNGTFTGTVNESQQGTVEVRYQGTGSIGSSMLFTEVHIVIGKGTGGLEGLHGQGTAGNSGPASVGTYSISAHFDAA
jgi:hypothetical protein